MRLTLSVCFIVLAALLARMVHAQPAPPEPGPPALRLAAHLSAPPALARLMPAALALRPQDASLPSCFATATGRVNVRRGPDVTFEREGVLDPGQTVAVNARAVGSDGFVWWRLEGGAFVRSDTVTLSGACDDLPSAADG